MRKIPGLKKLPRNKVGDIIDDLMPAGGWSRGGYKRELAKNKIAEKVDTAKRKISRAKEKITPRRSTKKSLKKGAKNTAILAGAAGGGAAIGGAVGLSMKREKESRENYRKMKESAKEKQNSYRKGYGDWLKDK